jgi:DNA (cytosine-5)-methyltransferase 1
MNHLDLFAGIGGFSLAAQWMGWETVAQVEWDKWCQKILAKNFPDALRFGDIVEFNKMLENGEIITDTFSQPSRFKDGEISNKGRTTNENRREGIRQRNRQIGTSGINSANTSNGINIGRIDILTGGFPCQPFSHAGKRKGTNDSRYLWPEMLTTIRILKPTFVVGENVAGLVSMENGKTLDRILSDLENEGYTTEQVIIPACAIGAWHRRDRIWIIAYTVNSADRTDRGQGREAESIQSKCGQTGLSREFSGTDTTVYDTNSGNSRLQGMQKTGNNGSNGKKSTNQFIEGCHRGREVWNAEPAVGRVANGIPNRVDRLKGLGNAIVPQVAYEIFKAIEQYDLGNYHN